METNKSDAQASKTADELAAKYQVPVERVAQRFNELVAGGLPFADASAAVEGEIAAGKFQPRKKLEIPVTESKPKIETVGKGLHRVRIADIIEEAGDDGRAYLTFVFQRKDGKGIFGFASAIISAKSKLYGWITNITGKAPELRTKYDVMGLIGRECNVYVGEKKRDDGTMALSVLDVTQAEGP